MNSSMFDQSLRYGGAYHGSIGLTDGARFMLDVKTAEAHLFSLRSSFVQKVELDHLQYLLFDFRPVQHNAQYDGTKIGQPNA